MNKTEQKIVREFVEMTEKDSNYMVLYGDMPEFQALKDLANNEIVEQEPTAEPMETPYSLADRLSFSFPEGQADAIAEHVYQPLLEAINEIEGQEPTAEPKKVYKLSEMWRIWHVYEGGNYSTYQVDKKYYSSLQDARDYAGYSPNVIAITPADATEFFVGQNLD
jgi:hypothetical protein